jgi:hypothetical protein
MVFTKNLNIIIFIDNVNSTILFILKFKRVSSFILHTLCFIYTILRYTHKMLEVKKDSLYKLLLFINCIFYYSFKN